MKTAATVLSLLFFSACSPHYIEGPCKIIGPAPEFKFKSHGRYLPCEGDFYFGTIDTYPALVFENREMGKGTKRKIKIKGNSIKFAYMQTE